VKSTILTLAAIAVLPCGCAASLRAERSTDLGFGFRRVVLAEPSQSSFESVGHFEYLYFGDHRLCQVGACSVAPSGRYAVYQDGPSGNLFLFCRVDRQRTQLTKEFAGLADSFQWHEDTGTVDVRFAPAGTTKPFSLQ
jgi:hypothetical protein